jgi:glycosyltransferase involved in cell wall biosynthesis
MSPSSENLTAEALASRDADSPDGRHLALFLPSLAGGGAERMFLHLARGFVERGHRVDLVLSRAEGPYVDEIPDGVQMVDLDAGKAPGYGAMGSLRPLARYLRDGRPDALLSAMSRVNVVAVLAARLARVDARVVVSERNHLSSWVENNDEIGTRVLPSLVRATYPLADGVVPISEGVADDLAATAGLDRESMTVVYNPVVVPEIAERAAAPVDHEWFHQSEEVDGDGGDDGDGSGDGASPAVVIGVGSLSTQKDFPTLVRAFARLRGGRDVRLVILGEGDERDRIEEVATEAGVYDDVWLPGFVDNPYRYVRRADVFALSSAWEGFGNVIVEALACGTPVVSTDCPSGPAEILQDGRLGPLVPVGDANALAEVIGETLDDPPRAERLRERADDFRYDAIADRYLDVLVPE